MLKDDIVILLEDSAQELGYMVYDYSLDLRGITSKISVKIDHLAGIKHSDCVTYSGRLAEKLDNAALLSNYSLEVSSPGLNRKLHTLEDFIRFINAPVKIVFDDNEKRETAKGTIKSVNSATISMSLQKEHLEIPFANIIRANLDY